MYKKIITFLISILVISLSMSACSSKANKSDQDKTEITSEAKVVEQTQKSGIVSETEQSLSDTSKTEAAQQGNQDSTWHFTTIDLDGNEINSQELFANSKLTLVNIWGTYCGPCKYELPDLGRLARDFADKDVQVLGIVSDVYFDNAQMVEIAKGLLADANVEYTNLTTNDEVSDKIMNQIFAIPTTFLIDSNGIPLVEPIIGGKSYDFFADLIENGLTEIDK